MSESKIKLFSGSSHPELGQLIAAQLQISESKSTLGTFSNGETRVEINESVRGCDVYIVQSGCGSINDGLMELIMMIRTCKLGSAARVTAVIPIFPYARQDKMDKKGVPVTARIVADLLNVVGTDLIITMDVHSPSIQGYFSIPVENLCAKDLIMNWIMSSIPNWKDAVLVSPDAGGTKRVTSIAAKMNVSHALIQKLRKKPNEVAEMTLFGDVKDRIAIIIDDMADTCGTLIKAASKLKEGGATQIIAMVTHGIFSGKAIENLNNSVIDTVVATNTIPQEASTSMCPKIQCIDVSGVFTNAILHCRQQDLNDTN